MTKIHKDKILAILLYVKEKFGKIDPDWILMRMRLHVLFWEIDKELFCKTGESLTGLRYYKFYVPMIKNKWFNETLDEIYSDLYDTSIAEKDFMKYSHQLVKRLREIS